MTDLKVIKKYKYCIIIGIFCILVFILHIIIPLIYMSSFAGNDLILYAATMISIGIDIFSAQSLFAYIIENIDMCYRCCPPITLIIKIVLTITSGALFLPDHNLFILLPLIYNLIISLSLIVGLVMCLLKNKFGDDKLEILL